MSITSSATSDVALSVSTDGGQMDRVDVVKKCEDEPLRQTQMFTEPFSYFCSSPRRALEWDPKKILVIFALTPLARFADDPMDNESLVVRPDIGKISLLEQSNKFEIGIFTRYTLSSNDIDQLRRKMGIQRFLTVCTR